MGGTFGKSGSWVVDHSMDDIPLTPFGRDKTGHGSIVTGFENTALASHEEELIETPLEKRGRKRSHYIVYTTVFVMSIGFSIVLTSVWPYLKTLNKDLEKNSLGFVVAANPFGQMLASPLLGLWGNKAGKIRGACLVTVAFFILGNVMYSLLALFENLGDMATYNAMIIARFIVGMSAANVTLCRSYLAQSTPVKDRTSSIAILAGAQALGFVFGPAIQTVLIVLIPEDVEVDTGIWWLKWNAYSAAGWVAAALGIFNLILLMPYIFQEYNLTKKEIAVLKDEGSKDEVFKLPKVDTIALTGLLFGFFIGIFIYVLIETLAVPFVSDQYAWTDKQAEVVVGVALMGGGLLASAVFPFSGFLSRKYDERKVLLICGFIPMILGLLLFLPYPGQKIPLQNCTSSVTSSMTTLESSTLPSGTSSWKIVPSDDLLIDDQYVAPSNHLLIYQRLLLISATNRKIEEEEEECTPGCPAEQEWCESVPRLPMAQLAVAFFFVMFGYPTEVSISQGLFSKMLGPKPQGVWMGVLTGVGSLGRIFGPIFVSYIYTNLGTYWCFGTLSVCMVVAFSVELALYRRFVAMKLPEPKTQHAYDGPAAITHANGNEFPKRIDT